MDLIVCNGLAESVVQITKPKNLLEKKNKKQNKKNTKDPDLAMLSHRTTVIDDMGLPPAEMMFSHRLKTQLATPAPLLQQKDYPKTLKKGSETDKRNKGVCYDHGSKPLKPLKPCDNIVM